MPLLNSLLPSFARSAAASHDAAQEGPAVRPLYQVKENSDAWTVTIQLPGATRESLSITDEEGTLTIRAERNWKQPAGWTTLYRESSDLPYALRLSHENEFDADKATAEFKEGVLQLSLPKSESRKPRKIAVA